MKKYNVSIDQPLCKTWEVEAESIDQALEIARDKYMKGDDGFVMDADDTGTDAQIMASAEDGSESTDWDDL